VIRVRGTDHFYWGVEHDSQHPDKGFITSSFLVETIPPYRHSTHAVRFRLANKELHIGLCRPGRDTEQARPTVHSDPEVAEELRGIYAGEDDFEDDWSRDW
jgi:hypothetical protein